MSEKKEEEFEIVKAELEIALSTEDVDDIMVGALEGGINYWCDEAKVVGDYLGEYASQQISRGGQLLLHDFEEDETYTLDKEKFLKGLCHYVSRGNTYCLEILRGNYGVPTGKVRLDTCRLDAGMADCIIQYALFDDVIYG